MGNGGWFGASRGSSGAVEEQEGLVGVAVGVHQGEHGVQGVVHSGAQAVYGVQSTVTDMCCLLPSFCWICLCWPVSWPVFLVTFMGQYCAPCCFPCCGNRWCFLPSQIGYIHALTVVQHQIKETCLGWLCCLGWMVKVQPGVLTTTVFLPTPPKYMYDEDKDVAYVMTFADYIVAKKASFPPYSGKYRAIDGGGNHRRHTFLGQGGRGYACNEPFALPSYSLPDPDEMQKDLQMRVAFRAAPWGINSLAGWFANIAIHEFFRSATRRDAPGGTEKPWVNLHSSYLDLQTLYGYSQEILDSIREFQGGRITRVADDRLVNRVHESHVILKLLLLEHNWVCAQLAARYPEAFDTDEKLFQQARCIMGGVFINLVQRQYGDALFGENAPDGKGFAELRNDYGWWPSVGSSQDVGNHATLCFNLIYRWHTTIPQEWTSGVGRRPIETEDEMRAMLTEMLGWESGGFGPNNMPEEMFRHVVVPAATVRDARKCGAPRLNDFRRRFAAPYTSFLDMCGSQELADRLAGCYRSVEDVELSVGLQIEKCATGGFSLGSTTHGAIIFDALNSIRQDRFYTSDYTPELYTDWGFAHTKSTNLVDLLNRHLDMGLDRNMMLSRLPSWKGVNRWSDLRGFPANAIRSELVRAVPCLGGNPFDDRGFPILRQRAGDLVPPSEIV